MTSRGPELVSITPADGDTGVVPSGKVTMLFNESIALKDNASATLTNNTHRDSTKHSACNQ